MPCNNRVRPDIKLNCNMGVIGVFREFAWFKRHNVIRFCTYKILNMNKKFAQINGKPPPQSIVPNWFWPRPCWEYQHLNHEHSLLRLLTN